MCFVKSALDPQVVRSAVVFFWVDPWPLDACRLNRQIIYIVNIVHGSKRNERKRQAASKCATKIVVSKVVRLRSRRTCHSSCPGRCCSRCHWHWQQGSVLAALGPSAAIAETRRSSAWNLYEFAIGVVICNLRVKYRMVLVQKTKTKNTKIKLYEKNSSKFQMWSYKKSRPSLLSKNIIRCLDPLLLKRIKDISKDRA